MGSDRTIWGSRSRIAAVMAPSVLVVATVNWWVLSSIRFPGARVASATVGLVGVVAGAGTIVASSRVLRHALDPDELCTDGCYRFVRHPLYAA